jgi:hypothetical protein
LAISPYPSSKANFRFSLAYIVRITLRENDDANAQNYSGQLLTFSLRLISSLGARRKVRLRTSFGRHRGQPRRQTSATVIL